MASHDILKRLERLEADHGTQCEGLHIRRIIVAPGDNGSEQLPVKGWRCASPIGMTGPEIATMRHPGESRAECWKRHDDAIKAAYGTKAVTMSMQVIE